MNRSINLSLFVIGFLISLAVDCSPSQLKAASSSDQAWKRFVKIVRDLSNNQLSNDGDIEAFLQGLKQLRLDERYASGWGRLVIAHSPRTEAMVRPEPRVWETDKQVLICSGDIYGDSRPEYVLGMGWMGPSGGVLCLYDSDLRKIAQVETECLWGIRIEDLTNEGKNEIICWSDAHHGSGLWDRRISIYKYLGNVGLKLVWEGGLYEQAGGHLDKYEIEIKKERDKPAVIVKKHILSQFSEDSSDKRKPVIHHYKLYPTETFGWSAADGRFVRIKANL